MNRDIMVDPRFIHYIDSNSDYNQGITMVGERDNKKTDKVSQFKICFLFDLIYVILLLDYLSL